MLNHCRALDLTDASGFLGGQMLAGLGVDVIKIEKPGGDLARNMGPFWADTPHPEKSLYWWAYNSGKRGITLNIASADGGEIFKKLVRTADFVLESFPPGYLDSLELGYDGLCQVKPDIILTSITPFGESGPYRDFQTADIVTMGMSGILYLTGDIDRPPLHMSLPQAALHAGADAAVGTLLAYYHREVTGEGQHVDISLQQSTAWFLANAIPLWELSGMVPKRAGAFRESLHSTQRQVWRCQDGYVFFNIIGGHTGAKTLHELVNWMEGEGCPDDFLKAMDWETLDMFTVNQETVDRICRPIEAFFATRPKLAISREAAARHISICPLSSMADLLGNDQLHYRDFWGKIALPELGAEITYPKRFVKSSEGDFDAGFRAPLVGEHNLEVYSEIGLSNQDLVNLKQADVI